MPLIEPAAEAWDAFLERTPGGHPLQTTPWAQLKTDFGWQARRLAVAEEGSILAGAQMLVRRLGPFAVAYVPKGPVVAEPEGLAELLRGLHQEARRRGAVYLKLEPEWRQGSWLSDLARAHGFRASPESFQPRSTLWVSLEGEEEEILGRMHAKWRYNIRLAGRRGIEVTRDDDPGLEAFGRIMAATGRRDAFGVHSAEYYRAAYRAFRRRGWVALFLARHDGRPVAGLMAFRLGPAAYYLFGGWDGREGWRMPNHALQWAAMCWAREAGCRYYDLWGIPDEIGRRGEQDGDLERRDGLWGVYRFKRGFGGQVVRYLPALDAVYRPRLHRLYRLLRRLR